MNNMARQNSYYLIQKNDEKSQRWAKEARLFGIELIPMAPSPILYLYILLKMIIHRGKPNGVILRYVNDYPSLIKTVIRMISEFTLIALILALRIELYWICHNVDKETVAHHGRISKLRRHIIARCSHKIFVTNKLLVKHFQLHFNQVAKKCYGIQFGLPQNKIQTDNLAENQALDFINQKKRENSRKHVNKQNVLVTFCAGTPDNEKYLHFDRLQWIIDVARDADYEVIAIVAGNFNHTNRGLKLKAQYAQNKNILLFDQYTEFSDTFVKQYIDFYWRAYADLSVPYTVYEAVKFQKPIMCLKIGFLCELIQKFGLGPTISITDPVSHIKASLDKIQSQQYTQALKKFQLQASWGDLINHLLRNP